MTRSVTLVVGPPGAGKTTWVSEHAGAGAKVVDFDRIAQSLGSPVEHDHSPEIVAAAKRERTRAEAAIASMTDGRAYVIRTAANPAHRQQIADRIGATRVLVRDPGRAVVEQRTAGRSESARAAVADWYAHN